MKTLAESLFDKDIVSSNINIEKLLKSKVTISDITGLIGGINEQDYDDIKNQYLVNWAEDFFNKYYRRKRKMLVIGVCGLYDPKEESCREAIDWLKFNKIHTSVCWNDQMYASSLDIDFFRIGSPGYIFPANGQCFVDAYACEEQEHIERKVIVHYRVVDGTAMDISYGTEHTQDFIGGVNLFFFRGVSGAADGSAGVPADSPVVHGVPKR